MGEVPASTQSNPTTYFIVGALRSGTTMFRIMMGHHPECSSCNEFEESVSQLEDTGWTALDDYYDYLRLDRSFTTGPSVEIDKSLDYPELVRSLFDQYTSAPGVKARGAVIHSNFHRCPDIWPEAKYIHFLRDPRDVARSCIGMGWAGNVYYGADTWVRAEKNWDKLCRRTTPQQRHEIKFEDLLAEPEETLAKACEFLGLEFDARMLSFHENSTYEPPDARLAEQWRRKLSEYEIWQVETKCRNMMHDRGYEAVSSRTASPSQAEALQLFIESKLGVARFAIDRYGFPLWFARRLRRIAPKAFNAAIQKRHNEVELNHLR